MKREYVTIFEEFLKNLDIPLPNDKGRGELFKINLDKIMLEEGMDFDFLVKNTEGYSGADISTVKIFYKFLKKRSVEKPL